MQVVRLVHEDHPLWYTDRVPLPEGALFYVAQHSTVGSGINTSESTLDLQQVLRQPPHHNRPGGHSPILGILFNYAFQVDLRSMGGTLAKGRSTLQLPYRLVDVCLYWACANRGICGMVPQGVIQVHV